MLTTIDVQETLRRKLNRPFRKYVILGACNPPLADRALHAELEIGLLLPCNVIVYEHGANESVVAAMAPMAALGIVGDNRELIQASESTLGDRTLHCTIAERVSRRAAPPSALDQGDREPRRLSSDRIGRTTIRPA